MLEMKDAFFSKRKREGEREKRKEKRLKISESIDESFVTHC